MKTLRKTLALLSLAAFAVALPAVAAKLKLGDKAPLVDGTNQDRKKWKLKDEVGRSIVVLYFYPKDDTPGCTKEACGFRDHIGDLKQQGVDVIGVSFDSVDVHKAFVFKYNLNFPLIADVDGKIADIYGARIGTGKRIDRRVSFLIDLNGNIVHIVDTPKAETHLSEMTEAIKLMNGKASP